MMDKENISTIDYYTYKHNDNNTVNNNSNNNNGFYKYWSGYNIN